MRIPLKDQIKFAMEKKGMSEEAFADAVHVSRTSVREWLAGNGPKVKRKAELEKALGCTLYWDGTPDPSDASDFGIEPAHIRTALTISRLPPQPQRVLSEVVDMMAAAYKVDVKSRETAAGGTNRKAGERTGGKTGATHVKPRKTA